MIKLPIPKKEAQKKRLGEWEEWLHLFAKKNSNKSGKPPFKYIPNAAWLLNDLYWTLVESYIRPLLVDGKKGDEEHLVHPYKIISASEFAIMITEPIEILGNDEGQKEYNALFAWFVATQILLTWDTGNPVKITGVHINAIANFKEHITRRKSYPERFALEHVRWLSDLNIAVERPIMLNAQCWRLFYLSCLAIASEGRMK